MSVKSVIGLGSEERYERAAAYARTYTQGRWAERINPEYIAERSDCANFVSQALRHGGVPNTDGPIDDLSTHFHRKNIWFRDKSSLTWRFAPAHYRWLRINGGKKPVMNPYHGRMADVIYMDYTHNRILDHVMIVTGVNPVRISQKSTNRSNITISTSIAYAREQYAGDLFPAGQEWRYQPRAFLIET